MKKLVCESLEEFRVTDDPEGDRKFMEEELKNLKSISSISEMDKWIFEKTCGHHFPMNPIEPLRTALREKLQELSSSSINERENRLVSNWLTMVEGEWKPIEIPDGAMF